MKSVDLWVEKQWQHRRKCSVVSTSVPHGHIGFTVSLKPCLNLCSFKWVYGSLNRDNNFTPIGSWTLNKKFSSFFSYNWFFKFIYRFCISNFWIKFIPFVNTIWKKNVLLKSFVLDGIHFNSPDDTDLKRNLFWEKTSIQEWR